MTREGLGWNIIERLEKGEVRKTWEHEKEKHFIYCKEDHERSLQAVCIDGRSSKYHSCQMKSSFVAFLVWVSTLIMCLLSVCLLCMNPYNLVKQIMISSCDVNRDVLKSIYFICCLCM